MALPTVRGTDTHGPSRMAEVAGGSHGTSTDKRGISQLPFAVLGRVHGVSDPRGVRRRLAIAAPPVWPSALSTASAPQSESCISRLNTRPVPPLSTLRRRSRERPRLTRDRRGSLRLRRMSLSSTAPRRRDRHTERAMRLRRIVIAIALVMAVTGTANAGELITPALRAQDGSGFIFWVFRESCGQIHARALSGTG